MKVYVFMRLVHREKDTSHEDSKLVNTPYSFKYLPHNPSYVFQYP